MTPDELRVIFNTPASCDADGSIVKEEKAQRKIKLQQVLQVLQQYWLSGSQELDLLAEVIADGSRDVSWRAPLGESGILAFLLGILSADLRLSLKIQALRLIGNACADEDENRAQVAAGNHLHRLVDLLADDSILAFVIPVLFNVCVDNEACQVQASQAGLGRALIALASGPRLSHCRAFLTLIGSILGMLVKQEPDVPLLDLDTPALLLNLVTTPPVALSAPEFYGLTSVAVGLLSSEQFQDALNQQGAVPSLLAAFSDALTKYPLTDVDSEDADDFKQVQERFILIIADVVAQPSFLAAYTLESPVVKLLETWILDPSFDMRHKTAACYALGNLARSDESSTYFVHDIQIHKPLIELLAKPLALSLPLDGKTDESVAASQLNYAILSFLKNLAIPVANKPALGVLLEPPSNILPWFWSISTNPQRQFLTISLARLLIVSCPENVRRICSPLSPDVSSPARERSNLHVLTEEFKRIDAEHTKTEAARVIATVCRILHTAPNDEPVLPEDWEPVPETATVTPAASAPPSSALLTADSNPNEATPPPALSGHEQPRRAHFYAALLDMSDALTFLLTQTRFPALRSEAIFVCALMSRSLDGGRLVVRALHPFEACRVVLEAVSGRDMVDGHELSGSDGPAPQEQSADDAAAGSQALSTSPDLSAVAELGLAPQQAKTSQPAQTARVDRENGLVLISEILKNFSPFLPPFRRSVFEQTLQAGGLLVTQDRTQAAEPNPQTAK